MTHYMTIPAYPLIYRLPYRGHPKAYNDNLAKTQANIPQRFDTWAQGIERGIITEPDDT